MKPALYCLTPAGLELGRMVASALDADLFAFARLDAGDAEAFDSLSALLLRTFRQYRGHVFVTACGIAVRAVAPLLESKAVDPAVVVLSQDGRHAVSLVSGHLGGANRLAREVADICGGQAVITTATDISGLPALDLMARDAGLRIVNPKAMARVSGAMLGGDKVGVFDPEGLLEPGRNAGAFEFVAHESELAPPGVWVHWRKGPEDENILRLAPARLHLGLGCRRGTDGRTLTDFILSALERAGLSPGAVAAVASIDLKKDEPGLIEAARNLGVEPRFFTAGRLDRVAVPNPSEMVREKAGTAGVCEASAILSSRGGRLILEKTKCEKATMAVALEA